MKPVNSTRDITKVQVIHRAARILRALRDAGSLSLSELARRTGLARSTTFRIVTTLEVEGLVSTTAPDGKVRLGQELLSLGAAVHFDLRRELRPSLEALSAEINETVDLSILENDHIVFVDQISRSQRLQAVSGVGIKFPLYCNAPGKAFLAVFSNEEIVRMFPEKLPTFTPHTLSTRAQLIAELEEVRAQGIAYDREEQTLGICAVGALVQVPVYHLAAISTPVPSVRYYGEEQRLIEALRQVCQRVDRQFAAQS